VKQVDTIESVKAKMQDMEGSEGYDCGGYACLRRLFLVVCLFFVVCIAILVFV
jgi:hypothetical protein